MISKNSSTRKDILIWRQGSGLVAKLAPELAEQINLNGRSLEVKGSLGDYDLLRSENGDLVGVLFRLTDRELKGIDPIIGTISSVEIKLPEVRLFLSPCANAQIETVQGSSWIYYASDQPVAIGVHEWTDWGCIAFPLYNDSNK